MDIQYPYSWHGMYSYFPSGSEFLVGFTQLAECSVSLAKGPELEAADFCIKTRFSLCSHRCHSCAAFSERYINTCVTGGGKVFPLQARCGPEGG